MTRHTPLQQLREACQIAQDFGMRVVEKPNGASTTFFLYRLTPTGQTFLGKRSSPQGIRRLVCQCADFH